MKTESPSLLTVNNLEVIYNDAVLAIQGISLKVSQGDIISIIGINGAGKTTLLRAISGFLPSDFAKITNGNVTFSGENISSMTPHRIARKGLVLVPETEKIFATLTTFENMQASVSKKKSIFSSEEVEVVFGYLPLLKDKTSQVAGYLSGGERQMLAIGMALLCQPKLLLIDELSMGLSPQAISLITEILLKIRKELGLTILLVEQNASIALKISDYVYVMETGKIVFDGTPEKLLSHEDIKEFYLGVKKSYKDVKQYRRSRRWWS
jgi:branched-chain amino acid transport system ATP-binding protein